MFVISCAGKDSTIPDNHIPPAGTITTPDKIPSQQKKLSFPRQIIVEHALKSIGASYQWGGASPETGFDCSGLTSYTHAMAGIHLPRTAADQINFGKGISRAKLKPGDLIFFTNPKSSKNLHVGIYIRDNLFVHAPGRGRHVTYADLNSTYFRSNYLQSRRYTD